MKFVILETLLVNHLGESGAGCTALCGAPTQQVSPLSAGAWGADSPFAWCRRCEQMARDLGMPEEFLSENSHQEEK